MKHLKNFDNYNESIGWSDDTISDVEKTAFELYNKVKSKISSFFSHGQEDNLDNENEYISYLDANFGYINWKDEKTAKYYIDTAKNALLGDRDPEVISKVCSTIYHLIEQ